MHYRIFNSEDVVEHLKEENEIEASYLNHVFFSYLNEPHPSDCEYIEHRIIYLNCEVFRNMRYLETGFGEANVL